MLFAPTLNINATNYEYSLVGSIMTQMKEPMEIDAIAEPMEEDEEDEPMLVDDFTSAAPTENPMELEEEVDIDGTMEMMETDENDMLIDDTEAPAGAVQATDATADEMVSLTSMMERMVLREKDSINDIMSMMEGMSLRSISGNKHQHTAEETDDGPLRASKRRGFFGAPPKFNIGMGPTKDPRCSRRRRSRR